MNESIKIEEIKGKLSKITNYLKDFYILIYKSPIPPKRKKILVSFIAPESFEIFEGGNLDYANISFEFEKRRPRGD